MRYPRLLHRRHHRQVPWPQGGYTRRSCLKHFGFPNPRRRHFQCDRRGGSWRLYLLRGCSPGHHGQAPWTRHFSADLLAFASSSAIRRVQRKNKQAHRFVLLLLDRECFQHREQLFRGESFIVKAPALLPGRPSEIHFALLPVGKGRSSRQAWKIQRLLPHLLLPFRPQFVPGVRDRGERVPIKNDRSHLQRCNG